MVVPPDDMYEPGDIVMDNIYPFVKVLMNKDKKNRCNNCFQQKETLEPCPTCPVYGYCDQVCLKQDWENGHAVECASECFRYYIGSDRGRYLFRMYALLKMHPFRLYDPVVRYGETIRCFADLVFRTSNAIDTHDQNLCVDMATRLRANNPYGILGWDILNFLYKMLSTHNTFGMNVVNESETCWIGHAIYIGCGLSVYGHSCKPNSAMVMLGLRIQIRAISRFVKGKTPTICYLGQPMDKVERRKRLQERRIECHCERCESDSDSYVDFEKLNSLYSKMSERYHRPNCPLDDTWATFEVEHLELLKMFREIYHEYDRVITDQYQRALTFALRHGVDKRKLKYLYEDTLHRIAITLGRDHPRYIEMESKFVAMSKDS